MFNTLLPGLRDLRVPLATGALWLLSLWLWAGEWFEEAVRSIADRVPSDLPIGPLPQTLWVSLGVLIAYLLGSVVQIRLGVGRAAGLYHGGQGSLGRFTVAPAEKLLSTLRLDPRWARSLSKGVYFSTYRDLDHFMKSQDNPGRPDGTGVEPDHQTLGRIIANIRQLVTRLQLKQESVYNRYDRVLSEAEFRVNVGPPIVVSAFGLHPELGAWSWLIALTGLILVIRGIAHFYEARSMVIDAVVAGGIAADVLERQEHE